MKNLSNWIRKRIEDEWQRNGVTRYTDALIDVQRYIEAQKVVLPQSDVIKSVCDHLWMYKEPAYFNKCTKCGEEKK